MIFTHKKNNDSLIEFATSLKLNVFTTSINNCYDEIKGKSGLLLSIHYRNIIKNNILKEFQGIKINLHPSLLPDYKGCFSSVWAIINGEKETGITYHILTEDIDAGNILIQEKIKINQDDTAYSLFHKLITLGIQLLPRLFMLVENNYGGTPQYLTGHERYYKRQLPYDGLIDPNWEEDKKERFIRAMYFPPYEGAVLKK
jgi:methionyl-tRNA formyltransferase